MKTIIHWQPFIFRNRRGRGRRRRRKGRRAVERGGFSVACNVLVLCDNIYCSA